MSKRLVTVALLTTLATGCTGRAAILGGALTAGAGVAMLMSSQSGPGCAYDDSSCQLGNDLVVAPIDAMGTTLGAITALAGTVLLLTGLATTDDRPAEVVRVPPTMTVMTGAPGSMLRAAYIVEEPIADALVAGDAPVPVRRALPADLALRARPDTRLALQISVVARAGQCEAAVRTGERLAALAPALYAEVVATDEAFAACLATTRVAPAGAL